MKKIFIISEKGGREGFQNVPLWSEIDCLPGEAEEVWAIHVLDRLCPDEVDATLKSWCDLVRVGGTLTLISLDLLCIAEKLVTGNMSAADAARLLYDTQETAGSTRRACFTLERLCDAVTLHGLTVIKRRHVDTEAHIIATRK